jgi:hypothetical protein
MRRLTAVLLVAVAVAGCKKSEPPEAPQAAPAPAPKMAEAAAAPQGASLKGKILERLEAPPYTYLKLQVGAGQDWAAVPKTEAKVGDEVTVLNAMPMNGFESKSLNRKFEVVYFGTLEGGGAGPMGAAPAPGSPMAGQVEASPANMAAQHANVSKITADVGDVKVPKATGADAHTVAEIHSMKAALKEKSVTLRGKVVKYNAGIMGKNWLHLRDGSGKEETADLTVTSQDAAAVGDVVLVKGVVRTDKDFGAGYAYDVIVEDAKITK